MTLREQVVRGGVYLIGRQGLGLGISLGGMLLLTRLIGPADYGLYAGALGLVTFLSLVAGMGTDVYLVRRETVENEDVYHQAFSFLVLSGLGLSGLGLLVSPLVAEWMGDPRFLVPLQAMLLFLPLMVLPAPAVARLERALDYKRIAGLELAGQSLFYALALGMAWRGYGVWSPIAGYLLSQTWMVGASYALARYRPRLFWSRQLGREMLGYGLGYSASIWVWQLRILANPLIVGRYLGPEGMGYVALSIRIVEALSFVKAASWRISLATLARVQQNTTRLRRALEEAMGLQVLAVGPLLAAFALFAPWALPLLFGEEWSPVLAVYPFIALGYMVNAVFNMHASVLYVLRHNWAVTVFHVVHSAVFMGAAALLVPRFGVSGYGLAEMVVLCGYLILHLRVARLFSFGYERAIPWLLAFAPPLFFPLTGHSWGLVLWTFPLVVLLSGGARAQVREYWSYFRKGRG